MEKELEEWVRENNPYEAVRGIGGQWDVLNAKHRGWKEGAEAMAEHLMNIAKAGDLSDGYHTFNELYDYRMIYNALLVNEYAKQGLYNCHKSKRHSDGEECFGGGWFIVSMTLPTGQVTNHYELKDWDKFKCEERERADKWDGHTPQEAFQRMKDFSIRL